MKTFLITLLSLLCLVGGLYAQDEPVNDTVYLTLEGDYGQLSIGLFQVPSTWILHVDWGNGRIETYGDGSGNVHMSWPDSAIVGISNYYEPGKYQIKLFAESGDIKSKLFLLALRQRDGFTSLDVSGCAALQYLDCGDNSLTSIDISGCRALDTLNCSHNHLTSLDVSGCTALSYLDCSDNQLASLDVSGCTALSYLICSRNHLASLDVSGCTTLSYLNCWYNQFTSLDVSGCAALTYLKCYGNQLTSLDVSGCAALQYLDCGDNSLTSIDISGCSALDTLKCYRNQLTSLDVSGCTALTYLKCYRNQLTSLDVSGCTALLCLNCSDNQLISLDLSKNTAMQELSCSCSRKVILDESGRLDLSTLAGFDVQRAPDCKKWYGGILSGHMVEFLQGLVLYDYPTHCVNPSCAFAYFCLRDNSLLAMPGIDGVRDGADVYRIYLSTQTAGATIYYTTDGSVPSEFSQQYDGVFWVHEPYVTIKAIAVKDGAKSRVATATFGSLSAETALSAATLRVYAQDRTIYLSEPAGEVEVFAVSGRRVYRGVATAIPVSRPGVYVVSAAGWKYKVGVK